MLINRRLVGTMNDRIANLHFNGSAVVGDIIYRLNENFNGTRANFSKIKLYQAVKSDLVEFMNMCDDVRMIDGYDPNMKEKHAILWLDFSPAATLNKEETAALTAIMNKADGTVISAVDGHVRISFDINDIWDN